MVETTVRGRDYCLREQIGVGGTSSVYRAVRDDGWEVAVKIAGGLSDTVSLAHASALIEREAIALTMLSQDGIVGYVDEGEDLGRRFLVTELLRGVNLRTRIREGGEMDSSDSKGIMIGICRSLGYVHDRGMVHCDVKPDNVVLIEGAGGFHTKLFDFNFVKFPHKIGKHWPLFNNGSKMGTPAYMSPEQVSGREFDQRADVYAMGVVIYEILCGIPPFDMPDPGAVFQMHLNEQPVEPIAKRPDRGISSGMNAVVMKALRKDPGERFRNMDEMMEGICKCP